jgi:hypothetical protein
MKGHDPNSIDPAFATTDVIELLVSDIRKLRDKQTPKGE